MCIHLYAFGFWVCFLWLLSSCFFLMSFVPIMMMLVVFVGSGCRSSWCTRCSVVYMVLGASTIHFGRIFLSSVIPGSLLESARISKVHSR